MVVTGFDGGDRNPSHRRHRPLPVHSLFTATGKCATAKRARWVFACGSYHAPFPRCIARSPHLRRKIWQSVSGPRPATTAITLVCSTPITPRARHVECSTRAVLLPRVIEAPTRVVVRPAARGDDGHRLRPFVKVLWKPFVSKHS